MLGSRRVCYDSENKMGKIRKIIAVLPHAPEPGGIAADCALYDLLVRLSKCADLSCVSEGQPLSAHILQAGFTRKGIKMLGAAVQPPHRFRKELKRVFRSKDFDAVLVVGSKMISRWIEFIRLSVPGKRVISYVPDMDFIFGSLKALPLSARLAGRSQWRKLLNRADGVWVGTPSERLRIFRTFAPFKSALAVVPPQGSGDFQRWVSNFFSHLGRRGRASGSMGGVLQGYSERDAAQLRRVLGSAAGKFVSIPASGSDGGDGVPALNRALRQARGSYVLLCLHPFRPEAGLFQTLREGLDSLPLAGALAPWAYSGIQRVGNGRASPKSAHFAAAFAMGRRGDWREVDYLNHACCVLLKREVVDRVGLLDERFSKASFAWMDYWLRLRQAGFYVYLGRDALALCSRRSRRRVPSIHDEALPGVREDKEMIIDKWCKGSLKFMESLLKVLEPPSFRRSRETMASLGGTQRVNVRPLGSHDAPLLF